MFHQFAVQREETATHPKNREDSTCCIEKDERVEVQDNILHLQPPEEVAEQEPGHLEDIRAVMDPRLLFPVPGRVRDVDDPEADDIELHEQVVAVPVPGIEIVEVDALEGALRDRRVAVLGVHHLPVAARDLGEHGECRVPDKPPRTHPLAVIRADQPVAHRVVASPRDDRVEKIG